MSWTGQTPSSANWSGATSGAGNEELYTVPSPSNTTINPSIGIVDGNLIPLPTSYNTLSVSNLNATTINGNPIITDASAWSTFPAYHDVVANSVSGLPAYDINNFRTGNFVDVNASNNVVVLNKTFTADCDVGNNDILRLDQGQGDLNVYGYALPLGDNALYVGGGTTLDGGTIHGTTIGCFPVAGINVTRIDVNQSGINVKSEVSGVFIQGANTGVVIKGGSLTGGYIAPVDIGGETISIHSGTTDIIGTNTNVSAVDLLTLKTLANPIVLKSSQVSLQSGALIPGLASNDDSVLLVGSIHGSITADGLPCILPLRINEARGVEIDNGTTWTTNVLNATTVNTTNLNVSGTVIAPDVEFTFVTIPQTTQQPPDWNSSVLRRWDQYAYVFNSANAGGDDLTYFATMTNEDIRPDTDTPGTWYLAIWNSGTTYISGQFIFYASNFYVSLQSGNVGHTPSALGAWWATTTNYENGYIDAGIQFAPIASDTSITMITKRGSRGNGELPRDVSINTKSLTNVELTDALIVQTPMYRTFDMGTQPIVNCTSISNEANITLQSVSGNINITVGADQLTITGNTIVDGNYTQNTGDMYLSQHNIIGVMNIINDEDDVNIVSGHRISTTSEGTLTLTSNSDSISLNALSGALNLTSASFTASSDGYAQLTSVTNAVDVTAYTDVTVQSSTGSFLGSGQTDAVVRSTTGDTFIEALAGNIYLTPATAHVIQAGEVLDMNNYAIINCPSINGHTLYAYGNFYNGNTSGQTLTATNTATRVKMDTTAVSSGITLDSSTNIGRLTFTNAGTYMVNWSGYLVHGSGPSIKTVIWIRLNGTDVAGTGKRQLTDSGLNDVSISSSSQIVVTAGQYIEFYWAASSLVVPLTTIAASSPYPLTPAFSCSITVVA